MQILSKKLCKPIVITAVITLISVFLRTVLMLVGFNKESLFYKNDIWATLLYAFVLISCVVIFLTSKNITTHQTPRGVAYSTFNLLSAAVMIGLLIAKATSQVPLMTIGRVTHWGAMIFLVISVIFYLLNSSKMTNTSSASMILLNVAPMIYLICQLIDCFTSISIKANSYYLFPDVLSLLALSFYVLYDGKVRTLNSTDNGIPMLAYSLLTILLLSFSVITDLIVPINLTATNVLLSILKIIYVAFSVLTVVKTVKTEAEDKQ